MSVKRIALRLEVFAVLVVHDLGLVLRGDAGEELALGLGDAELLVGGLHLFREHVPVGDLTLGRLDVVVDVVEVDVGMFLANHSSIGLRSKRFSALSRNFVIHSGSDLRSRDVADDLLVEALLGRVDVVARCRASRACTCRDRCPGRPWRRSVARGSGRGGGRGISTTQIVTIPGPAGQCRPASHPRLGDRAQRERAECLRSPEAWAWWSSCVACWSSSTSSVPRRCSWARAVGEVAEDARRASGSVAGSRRGPGLERGLRASVARRVRAWASRLVDRRARRSRVAGGVRRGARAGAVAGARRGCR